MLSILFGIVATGLVISLTGLFAMAFMVAFVGSVSRAFIRAITSPFR